MFVGLRDHRRNLASVVLALRLLARGVHRPAAFHRRGKCPAGLPHLRNAAFAAAILLVTALLNRAGFRLKL